MINMTVFPNYSHHFATKVSASKDSFCKNNLQKAKGEPNLIFSTLIMIKKSIQYPIYHKYLGVGKILSPEVVDGF